MNDLAILGTGYMGAAIAERLLEAGKSVAVFNRTRSKAQPLADRGAQVAATAAEAVSSANVILLLLADAPSIHQVLFEQAPLPVLQGKTIIQMGTITPEQSRALLSEITGRGGEYFEAPIMGSPIQARAGKLIVMLGGAEAQAERWNGLFSCLAASILRVGEVGSAAALKLAMNQMIAMHMASFALSYGFVEQTGVDPEIYLSVLRQSALHAPMFDNKLPKMRARDFTRPNFPVKLLLKDIKLFLEAAKATTLDTAALEGIRAILERSIRRGLGEMDYSALSEVVRNRIS